MRASESHFRPTRQPVLGFVVGLVMFFVGFGSLPPVALASASDPMIVTESGRLQGMIGPKIEEYLGIPYAAPPMGTLRWLPPQPYGRWSGIFQATATGSPCPQLATKNSITTYIGNEDCLFLNIYTPHGKTRVKPNGLAVMVWVHGGGLTKGAGSDYDPTPLVTGGQVIVVTLNYRLGALGFFAQHALDTEGRSALTMGLTWNLS